jgi:hypothetical protein
VLKNKVSLTERRVEVRGREREGVLLLASLYSIESEITSATVVDFGARACFVAAESLSCLNWYLLSGSPIGTKQDNYFLTWYGSSFASSNVSGSLRMSTAFTRYRFARFAAGNRAEFFARLKMFVLSLPFLFSHTFSQSMSKFVRTSYSAHA